jgi:DNA-binding response OmpR family regulator
MLRILVIEDESRIRSFLARALEADGFAVDGADNGHDGLERAVRGSYDLVILDLLLPRLDGLSVLHELHRRSPDVPVVIVSARADLSTKLRGFALGANDYLAKPFAVDELLARVRAQLRAHATGRDGVIQAGNLVLDIARRRARIRECEIDLSDREFRLLHHLLKHAAGRRLAALRSANEWLGILGRHRFRVAMTSRAGVRSPVQEIRRGAFR